MEPELQFQASRLAVTHAYHTPSRTSQVRGRIASGQLKVEEAAPVEPPRSPRLHQVQRLTADCCAGLEFA